VDKLITTLSTDETQFIELFPYNKVAELNKVLDFTDKFQVQFDVNHIKL